MDDLFKDVEEIKADGEQPLHFYYNREERIAKASPQVQEYYRGGMRPVKGIRVLFLKQNRFIFLSLIILVAMTFLYTGLNKPKNTATIEGIKFELFSFCDDEKVYISLKMNRNSKEKDNFPVPFEAEIRLIENNDEIYDKKTVNYIYNEGEEFLRGNFINYETKRVDMKLKVGNEEKVISAYVEKR